MFFCVLQMKESQTHLERHEGVQMTTRFSFLGELLYHFNTFDSLLHFLRAEIQVAVADPLHLKPVLVVVVAAALELHLKVVDGLLLEAAAGRVGVLVEADAVLQADLQGGLQAALHCVTQDD